MLDLEHIHEWFADGVTGQLDRILLVLLTQSNPAPVSTIKTLLVESGLTQASRWNIADSLRKSKMAAVCKPNGWVITSVGKKRLTDLGVPLTDAHIVRVQSSLRSSLIKITNPDQVVFLEEAIANFESNRYRSAVVLSWVGAVSILYDHVLNAALAKFNAEAISRDSKWRKAKNCDDLARMNERKFLDIMDALSLLGKSVKLQLQACLDLRNACGHPNSFELADHTVASHIEILILNVYSKY